MEESPQGDFDNGVIVHKLLSLVGNVLLNLLTFNFDFQFLSSPQLKRWDEIGSIPAILFSDVKHPARHEGVVGVLGGIACSASVGAVLSVLFGSPWSLVLFGVFLLFLVGALYFSYLEEEEYNLVISAGVGIIGMVWLFLAFIEYYLYTFFFPLSIH